MKITIRLWLLISAVAVFILGLIWTFLILLLPGVYLDQAYNDLDSSAEELLQMWEQLGGAGDLTALDRALLDRVVNERALHVDIRTQNGIITFESGWPLDVDVLTPSDMEQALQGHYITREYIRPGMGSTLIMAKPIYTPQQETMVLLICSPMAPVEALQILFRRYMLIISALSLSAALAIGFLTSRMFVKPVRRAEQAAGRIAMGDYSERMNSKDGSELGDLARALDNMADQLGQLEIMRQDFIATVSHQFKTPLSIIQGHTEWIQDSLPASEAESLRGSFEVIADEISRLDRMSRNILKLSELQSAVGPSSPIELPLLPFCRDIVHSLEILSSGVRFDLRIPESLRVPADAADLDHVFRNLLQNALVHAQPTRIEVTAAYEGAYIRVSIRDNGNGMTAEQSAHIWERFYKGNQKDRSGSGLGMSIAAAAIEKHGGQYGVTSTMGKGTEVWFTLPSM